MTERVQQTEEEKAEQEAFAAVGGEDKPQPEKVEAKPVEPPKTEETKPEAKPEPKKAAEQKPKEEYVRLSKTELESLKASAGRVPELEKKIETAFGKFGPLTQMINELKAATPKGQAVELPADVVSELEAEFPELAGGVKAALTKALKGLIGTGKSDVAPEDVLKNRFEEYATKRAIEDLEEAHPDWRKIVGEVDASGKANPAHPFRAWLAKQPQAYQDKINNTQNPTVIGNAISKFQASQRAAATPAPVKKPVVPTKKVLLRKKRFQGSVTPKGLGAPPPAQRQSEEDAFAEGFRAR